MRLSILVLLSCLSSALSSYAQLNVSHLHTENLTDPLGLDCRQPRLSWVLESPDRGVLQTAYELRVDTRPDGGGHFWSTGKIESDQSIQVVYNGPALNSGEKYYWQVRVWDNKGRTTGWSAKAFWQMGLLTPADWKAVWIEPAAKETPSQPSPLLRTSFTAQKDIASATLYITAHGLYEAQLNGRRIGDACLTPGWTSYNKRLQYQTYDVTDLVKPGRNAVGACLGNGWYRGYIAFEGHHNIYGSKLGLLLQLAIRYKDGHTETIVSGPGWKSSTAEIIHSEIYDGETIDHRLGKKDWSLPSYDEDRRPGKGDEPVNEPG